MPLVWGKPQVIELLLLLDKLHLSAGVLKSHWTYIKQISTTMNHCILGIEKNLYDVVIARCKPINDNKCPVSRELLAELCAAAPVVFQMYNAKLARAMFICAFAGFMRCCEFTESSGNRPNHNLLDHSVNVTQDHLGISFWSDKCSYNDLLVKHRLVSWEFLPAGAAQMVADYINAKPAGSGYFFVKEDGQTLSRKEFTNLLEACILHTRWCHLHCMPHCFRAGAASSARLDGESISDVEFYGQWAPKSKAVDHYTKTI